MTRETTTNMLRLVALTAVATSGVAACRSTDATELMVEVDVASDVALPPTSTAVLDTIELRVLQRVGSALGDGGTLATCGDGGATPPDAGTGVGSACPARPCAFVEHGVMYVERFCRRYRIPADHAPPLTLGVTPDAGDADPTMTDIEFRASASLGGMPYEPVAAHHPFVRDQLVRLYLTITARCLSPLGMPLCPDGETCSDDRCVPIAVPDPCLGVTVADASSCGPDGSVVLARDAAPDGAPDAGPVDAGPTDAGPTDAGPRDLGPPPVDSGPTCACSGSTMQWRQSRLPADQCLAGGDCYEEQRRMCNGCNWTAWTYSGACVTSMRDPC